MTTGSLPVERPIGGLPAEPPSISVVICAYTEQRWDDVLAAVQSVREQEFAPAEILLVVDHNPALQERLAAELPDVHVVANDGPRGLSGGKNTGVALARGSVVAFLDDDAVAGPGWLAHMAAGYARPEVAGVGGLTLPLWETGRPRWFPEEFDWVVGCTFVGREPGAVRNLLGGNASFRREVFAQAGGFPSHIGRTSGDPRPLGCEETEFCIRVSQRRPGSVFLFEPGAVIWHRAPAARERFSYFRSRCYAEGLSKALVTRSVGRSAGLSEERRYAAVTLRRGVVRGIREGLRGETVGFARAGAITVGLLATTAGYVVGTAQNRRPVQGE
ncbi:glycosyltransferase family 2 protein [Geodermatophilus sp. URMC 60]|jgi:GT2 family glycosyltransferase